MGEVDYRARFKSCGADVVVEEGGFIEHPEVMEVGDRVRFMRGFSMGMGGPGGGGGGGGRGGGGGGGGGGGVGMGSDVTFYPICFVEGAAGRFLIGDHVDFFPGTYISLGDETSFVEVGHHSHFAPNCVLYGWGGL